MKKIWKYFILLALLGALMCTAAFAVDEPTFTDVADGATFTLDASGEKFEVEYTGTTSGDQYLILMVAAGDDGNYTITDTSIQYVNQDAADADGVAFTVYPTAMVDAKIMLGGVADGPVLLGKLDMPEPEGFTVSGTAVSWNDTDDAVYLLYGSEVSEDTIKTEWNDGSYATSANVVAAAEGGAITGVTVDDKAMQSQPFSFETVADGTYWLAICKPGKYVPKIIEVTVDGENIDLGQQKLWLYGDVNYDGRIRTGDATQVLQYIAKKRTFTAEEFVAADVTGDGNIRTGDATQIKRYIAKKSSDFDDMK